MRINRKTGKPRKKLARPRTSMTDKLSNLHLLLRAPYFSKMPLELRFFNASVYKAWQVWDTRVDKHIPPSIAVVLDLPKEVKQTGKAADGSAVTKKSKAELFGSGGVAGIDPTYARFQPVLLKLRDFLAQKDAVKECDVCEKQIDVEKELFNICLDSECCSLTHIGCLSERFLRASQSKALLPKAGTCPSCHALLEWSELMRLLSLRMRGQKEVNKLLKKRKGGAATVAAEIMDESESEIEDVDMLDVSESDEDDSDLDEEVPLIRVRAQKAKGAKTSPASKVSKGKKLAEVVIADSEDEG